MKAIITSIYFLLASIPVFSQTSHPALEIKHLAGDFYVYTTWTLLDLTGNPFPSNSMYMLTNNGVVMFDTPWDTTQFQPLLDSIWARHHQKVILCIVTHFHDDRTAGLGFLNAKGVKTYSSELTYQLSIKHNAKLAAYRFTGDTTFTVGNHAFSTYYPGEGHSPDNLVIWFDKEQILYGGCLVKSVDNNSIGNLSDANVAAWPATIQNVIDKYPKPKFVIPGHMQVSSNAKPLKHSLKLLKENAKKKRP